MDDEPLAGALIKGLLWEEFGVTDQGEFITTLPGGVARHRAGSRNSSSPTSAIPSLARQPSSSPRSRARSGSIIDYPFDEGNRSPAEDRHRVATCRAG